MRNVTGSCMSLSFANVKSSLSLSIQAMCHTRDQQSALWVRFCFVRLLLPVRVFYVDPDKHSDPLFSSV
jgi:hypothetical protein